MLSARRATFALLVSCLFGALLGAAGYAAPAAKKKASTPPNLSADALRPTITVADPKRPGWLLAVVKAAAFQGGGISSGFLGNMTQVSARLFQQGKPAATLDAPRARGSQNSTTKNVVVTATGGVVVKSLLEPGTRMTADTVVWYPSINKIVATGHVVYHAAKTNVTVESPVMTADTRLKSVQTSQGHATY